MMRDLEFLASVDSCDCPWTSILPMGIHEYPCISRDIYKPSCCPFAVASRQLGHRDRFGFHSNHFYSSGFTLKQLSFDLGSLWDHLSPSGLLGFAYASLWFHLGAMLASFICHGFGPDFATNCNPSNHPGAISQG